MPPIPFPSADTTVQLTINGDHLRVGKTGPDWVQPNQKVYLTMNKTKYSLQCVYKTESGDELQGEGPKLPVREGWVGGLQEWSEVLLLHSRAYRVLFPELEDSKDRPVYPLDPRSTSMAASDAAQDASAPTATSAPPTRNHVQESGQGSTSAQKGPAETLMTTEEGMELLKDWNTALTDDLAERIRIAVFSDGLGLKVLPDNEVLRGIQRSFCRGTELKGCPELFIFLSDTNQHPAQNKKSDIELIDEALAAISTGQSVHLVHKYRSFVDERDEDALRKLKETAAQSTG